MPANMNLDYPTKSCTPLTTEELQLVLEHLSEGFSVTSAARAIKRSRQAIYNYAEKNPEFKEAMRQYHEEGTDGYEDRMRTLALNDGPQTFLATIASLKARRREKWGDQPQSTGHTVPTINITIVAPSPTELRDIVAGEYKLLPDPAEAPHKEEAYDADSST